MTLWSVHLCDSTVHTVGLGVSNFSFFSEHFKSLQNDLECQLTKKSRYQKNPSQCY